MLIRSACLGLIMITAVGGCSDAASGPEALAGASGPTSGSAAREAVWPDDYCEGPIVGETSGDAPLAIAEGVSQFTGFHLGGAAAPAEALRKKVPFVLTSSSSEFTLNETWILKVQDTADDYFENVIAATYTGSQTRCWVTISEKFLDSAGTSVLEGTRNYVLGRLGGMPELNVWTNSCVSPGDTVYFVGAYYEQDRPLYSNVSSVEVELNPGDVVQPMLPRARLTPTDACRTSDSFAVRERSTGTVAAAANHLQTYILFDAIHQPVRMGFLSSFRFNSELNFPVPVGESVVLKNMIGELGGFAEETHGSVLRIIFEYSEQTPAMLDLNFLSREPKSARLTDLRRLYDEERALRREVSQRWERQHAQR